MQNFSPTLLVEVEYDQLKYGGCIHLSKLCVWGEKGSSTRVRSPASPGRAGRNTRAHDVRVDGPPKSGPSPCGGAASFGFLIFRNRSRREVVGLFYITDLSASTKTYLIELGFYLSSLLCRLRSCFIPNAGVHRRTGEPVSRIARSCDPAPGEGE